MSVERLGRRDVYTWTQTCANAVRLLIHNPREARLRIMDRVSLLRFALQNVISRRSVTGDAECILCVTSYGERVELAYIAIESIVRGKTRPRQFYLWLDDEAIFVNLPPTLRRLRRRGLQIVLCEDFGPHKKQYPLARLRGQHDVPLVTADDDMVYPASWLNGLLHAFEQQPDVINGYRARSIAFNGGEMSPYSEWVLRADDRPSLRTMITGVSGVIYPPRMLDLLNRAGTDFLELAPAADDVWVHSVAVRGGIRSRQIDIVPRAFRPVRGTVVYGTHEGTLTDSNVGGGQNDVQIAQCYDHDVVKQILADQA